MPGQGSRDERQPRAGLRLARSRPRPVRRGRRRGAGGRPRGRGDGQGEGHVPLGEEHLVVRAVRAAGRTWGLPHLPGLRLRATTRSRTVGGSAPRLRPSSPGSSLADLLSAGPGGGRGPAGRRDPLEGHPDNAAAALLGGFTIAWSDVRARAGDPRSAGARRPGAPARLLEPVVLVPEHRLETRHARSVLPGLVPHRDAARTAGRAALLVHAMTADPGLLLPATEDWLHQQPRSSAMPETLRLVADLRARVSPQWCPGPGRACSCSAWDADDGGLGEQGEALTARPPAGWQAMAPEWRTKGRGAGCVPGWFRMADPICLMVGSPEAPRVLD